MNNIFYTKTTNFKLFGIPIFSKTTFYNETEHDTAFDIVVTPEYFNNEFELKKEIKDDGKN